MFAFLRWWLFMCVVAAAGYFMWKFGLAAEIIEKDESYICIATVFVFAAGSLMCGAATGSVNGTNDLNSVRRKEEATWFLAELCLVLGMAGTIIGFIMMLSGFDGLDISDHSTVQSLLSSLGSSMATALYTTIVGLTCGALLKIQCFNLNMAIDRRENV